MDLALMGNMLSLENIALWDVLPLISALVFICPLILDEHSKVRYYSCYILYVGFSSTVGVILAPFFLLRPRNVLNCWVAAEIIKHLDKIIGITWEVRNGHILEEDRGAVVCSNHQSIFDVLGMFKIWGLMKKCTAIAKRAVMYTIPFGPAAWLAGVVFIDRHVSGKAMSQMQDASKAIHDNKTKLWIFPEGTRNRNGGKLLPFKKGAFIIAIECQAPIIPVVYSPYYFINGSKKAFGRGKVVITVLDPIPTKGLTLNDIDSLMSKCYDVMSSTYEAVKVEAQSFK